MTGAAFSHSRKPNTHRRRDSSASGQQSTADLSCVGGVNEPVGSRDPVYIIPCAVELLRLVTDK